VHNSALVNVCTKNLYVESDLSGVWEFHHLSRAWLRATPAIALKTRPLFLIWGLPYFEGAMFSKLKSSKGPYFFSSFSYILYVFYYFNTTSIQTIILVVYTNGTYLNSRFHLMTIHNLQNLKQIVISRQI